MTRLVAGLGWSLLLSALLSMSRAEAQLTGEPNTFDFGEKNRGAVVDGEFVLKNTGKKDLVLVTVRFDCQCATGKPEKGTLTPGEASRLPFRFDTRPLEGKIAKSVLVSYRVGGAKTLETLRLVIRGDVRSSWWVEPALIQLGDCAPNSDAAGRFRVCRRKDAETLTWRLGRAPGVLRLEKVDEPHGSQGAARIGLISWSFKTPTRPGPFEHQFIVFSNDPIKPSYILRITGEILGDIRAEPRRLLFGAVSRDKGAQRRLKLKSVSGRPFVLREVRETPELHFDFESGKRGVELEVLIDVPKGLPSGRRSGFLQIRTDRIDQPWIKVPWEYRISP